MKTKIFILIATLFSFYAVGAKAQSMTDGQIAEILEEANEAEIDAAKIAKDDARNKEVKDFAKHMLSQHEVNKKDAKKIVKKADIDQESSQWSKALKEDAKNKKSLLKKQTNTTFDKTYIDQQVSMHQQLLNDLDQKYIPQAKNPEFKAHLQSTRTHVSEHLERAKSLQSKL